MPHWSDAYLDIPHAQLDCGELVERVLREQFGRDVTFPRKQRPGLIHRSGLITDHADEFATRIGLPVDGCGVLMIVRGRLAHIGLYCDIDGTGHVLHSDSLFGASVRLPLFRMQPPRYRIEGFYAWR